MKRSRFAEEQIVKVLKHQENGLKLTEIFARTGFVSRLFTDEIPPIWRHGILEVEQQQQI